MTSTEDRVRSALQTSGGLDLSHWSALMELYRTDREAFYRLACDGVRDDADATIRKVADLANHVRYLVRSTYQIEPAGSESGAVVISPAGDIVNVPPELVADVKRFLLDIDGKSSSTVQGKDFVGSRLSEAEARFKLGDRSSWENDRRKSEARLTATPMVLRVDPHDLNALTNQPSYVRHGLLKCATKVVLAPTVVFEGLNRGEGSIERLRNGLTFCGKPRWAYDCEGKSYTAPQGMVYLVYVDHEHFVFDWDWVKENPGEPGYPIDWPLRFGNPVALPAEATLEVPESVAEGSFDESKAAYSERGDCVFCYISDEPAFAHRYNSDLTVFRQFGTEKITGFKVKNVRRICLEDKSINLDDAPELNISADAILLASLKGHKDASVEIYTFIIRALLKDNREPPKVTVPRKAQQLTPS